MQNLKNHERIPKEPSSWNRLFGRLLNLLSNHSQNNMDRNETTNFKIHSNFQKLIFKTFFFNL